MWRAAAALPALPAVTVTSYNEWGEGTQIEPAAPYRAHASRDPPGRKYDDYAPRGPGFYLERTAQWIDTLREKCTEL